MALELKTAPEGLMSDAELAAWHDIPPAVISDELNRTGAMAAAIKPLAPGMKVVGQALTVQTMVGDNAALHYCLTVAWARRRHRRRCAWTPGYGRVGRYPYLRCEACRSRRRDRRRQRS